MEIEDREPTDSGSLNGNMELESPSTGGESFGRGGGGVPGAITMNISGEVVTTNAVAAGGSSRNGDFFSTLGKKKRGRPRKYDAEGNLNPSYIKPSPPPLSEGFNLPSPPSYELSSGAKRGRGRPPGSKNLKTLAAMGEMTACGDFTPHVITVEAGEDVAGKILTFAQKGNQGICVLSANGPVSSATLRHPGSSGGLMTYEGLFDILTLSGSYTVSDDAGIKSRTGGLSISLASQSGRVIGGGVAGMLTAASLIQIVVGTFVPNGFKMQKHRPSPAVAAPLATVVSATPMSQEAPESTPIQSLDISRSQGEADQSFSKRDLHSGNGNQNGSGYPASIIWHPHPDINIPMPTED